MSGLGEVRPAVPPKGDESGSRAHLFTADVEEYFQVSAFEGVVSRKEWETLPSRVEGQVDRLLDILGEKGTIGTFFVLGWVAERHPDLVRRIAAEGHEVASHGWWHRRIPALDPERFREEARRSKQLLEDIAGRPVLGFRAPNFSLVPGSEWALDVLIEEGYRYDSSVFPVRWLRPGYGGGPRVQSWIRRPAGRILELPVATAGWGGLRFPAGGGAYFRQLPYGLTRSALKSAERDGAAGVFYLHPWELDRDQPELPVPRLARLRHYRNLDRTESRLIRLLREFSFTSIERCFGLRKSRERDASTPALSPA